MKKAKKLVVANWKMNPVSTDEAKKIVTDVKKTAVKAKKTEVVICPPFVFIPLIFPLTKTGILLGAQNAHSETLGSYTGEVSYSVLSQFNVSYVIVGHSERRNMGETDEMVNKKVKSVVSSRMTAIVCIGESERDHGGDYLEVIKNQVSLALRDISKKSLENIVIAYEPVWAIGAKDAMEPRDLHEMSIFIRKILRDMFGVISDSVQIIYGGSVDKVNCEALIRDGNVSGFLIGRQSLRPKDFSEIIKLVDAA